MAGTVVRTVLILVQCDLQQTQCSPCLRAGSACYGWREVHHLRIHDESKAVMRKATKATRPPTPKPLQLDIGCRARDAFYLHYVSNSTSRCWTFLEKYYPASSACPDYLARAIDALSLTHLWHEAYSEAALVAARKCYVRALRETRKALTHPPQGAPQAVILAALVLDLVEKIISASLPALSSHIDGALGIVDAVGLVPFQNPNHFPILVRLSNHALFGCLVSRSSVPAPLVAFRTLVRQGLDATDQPKYMDQLFIRYIDLQYEFHEGTISRERYAQTCYDLDLQLALGESLMPVAWQYTVLERQLIASGLFGQLCHVYQHRNFTQATNMIRIFRILLNEAVIDYAACIRPVEAVGDVVAAARANINTLVTDICASVAQYADCSGPVKSLLPVTDRSTKPASGHAHTHHHVRDCYTLLFPLYAAARSHVSIQVRNSIKNQLHYIADHCCIRNAKYVTSLLERETPPGVWEVYTQLGSYAFMA